jgi:hypothetical protein
MPDHDYGRAAVKTACNLLEATTRGFTPRSLFLSDSAARDLRAQFRLALYAIKSLNYDLCPVIHALLFKPVNSAPPNGSREN